MLLTAQCGSMPFCSPEIMCHRQYCGFKTDVWSLGVLSLEVVCGLHFLDSLLGWVDSRVPPSKKA